MNKQTLYDSQKNSFSKNIFKQTMLSILQEKPFHKLSTSELIERSGYSRGSFYKNFDDKYDLMRQLVRDEAENYVEIICSETTRGQSSGSLTESTYPIILHIFQNVLEKKPLYDFILHSDISGCNLENFCMTVIQLFRQKAEVQTMATPITEDIYYYCNTQLLISYIKFWAMHNFSESPESMAKQVTEFLAENNSHTILRHKEFC